MSPEQFPRPLAWLAVSVRRRFASSTPIAAFMTFSTLILGAVLIPALSVSASLAEQNNSTGVLTQIEVLGPDGFGNGGPRLTTSSRETIRSIPGVANVSVSAAVGIAAAPGEGTWTATVHTANLANLPPDTDAAAAAALTRSEVIVPVQLDGHDLELTVGKKLPIEYTQSSGQPNEEKRTTTLSPVATYDPAWQGYGPGAIIASEEKVIALLAAQRGLRDAEFLSKQGVPALIVTTDDETALAPVAAQLRELGFDARPTRDSLGELPGVIAVSPTVFAGTAIAAGIVTVLLVSSVVRNSVVRRAREFGLLRIRGWRVSDVRRLLILDIGAGSLLGAVIGTALGVVTGAVLSATFAPTGTAVVFSSDLLLAMVGVVLAPVALAVSVGLASSHRALSRDPYLALVQSG